jgi:hypothetical protein
MTEIKLKPPVTHVSLVTPYPDVRVTSDRVPLDSVIKPGRPAVLHLFTG